MDKKYKWPDPKAKEVADVVGMSVEDAKAELEGLNVIIEGDGDKVIHQSPEAGVKLDEGETVRLFVE